MKHPRALWSSLPLVLFLCLGFIGAGCKTYRPGVLAPRAGDEIMVAGRLVHTGARVVLWTDPGGYDAYRVERRFSPFDQSNWETSSKEVKYLTTPNRYNLRQAGLSAAEIERVRGGGWDMETLAKVVDQFVLHYDVCGTSRQCFKVLQDMRGLSVHFMLDLDGTIYQTLDLKERAWHATSSNTRSIGVEIANMGAYGPGEKNPFAEWYATNENGGTRITLPERFGDGGLLTPNFVGHPASPQPVSGRIQNRDLIQYDFTPEQYAALTKLTAALCAVFPKLKCDYPRDADGNLLRTKLPDADLEAYQGILGHFHIQENKVDPGPAFRWDEVVGDARKMLHRGFSPPVDRTSAGHMQPRQ